jgi:release factor glutamine methyltransferase
MSVAPVLAAPGRLVGTALCDGAARLRKAGIENPRREARLLLAHALGVTTETLLRDPRAPIGGTRAASDTISGSAGVGAPRDGASTAGFPSNDAGSAGTGVSRSSTGGTSAIATGDDRGQRCDTSYDALLDRRVAHEPLALITGRREFWSLDLAVSGATLIPRADSETLIEAALGAIPDRGRVRRILDLGTGTGCLLLAALREFPAAFGVGTDRSVAATTLARDNAAMLGMAHRAAFLCTDWAAALTGGFDLVLSNPPYIPTGELPGLMPEVARYEPALALDGGPDGLRAYRLILSDLPRLLAADGVAVLELGQGQDGTVGGLARAAGFVAATRDDLAGIPRALLLTAAGV